MRQVPFVTSYLIIGNGRVARHVAHYLTLLNLQYHQWHRAMQFEQLQQMLPQASHVLLLINDDAIEPFIQCHLQASSQTRIHFSGSLLTKLAYRAHPLMSFNHELYALEEYVSIPFIIDDAAPAFEQLLPGLPNRYQRLSSAQQEKYHALCVMSGNFSCLLWQKLMKTFEQEFNMPASMAHPYLQRQMKNIITNYNNSLTGPLVRNDVKTIDRNIAALANDPFQKIYQAFVDCYAEVICENS